MSHDILKILERGYVCCNNDNVSFPPSLLLSGINPSCPKDADSSPGMIYDEFSFATATGRYWSKKQRQFGDLKKCIPYQDLFPIRETHQHCGFEVTFRNANDIKARFLEITQSAIEEMAPKMIIHANRNSMYYWGIKKYGGGNDIKNPWLGYKVERLTRQNSPALPCCMTNERLTRFPLYRIVGLLDSPKRINCNTIKHTSLTYLMEYVMEYRKTEDRERFLYKPNEWKEIIDWLND